MVPTCSRRSATNIFLMPSNSHRRPATCRAEWDKLKPVLDELNAKPAGNAFTDLKQPLIRAIERGGSGEGRAARHRDPDRRPAQLGAVAVEQGPRARVNAAYRSTSSASAPRTRRPTWPSCPPRRPRRPCSRTRTRRRSPRAHQQSAAGQGQGHAHLPRSSRCEKARTARRGDQARWHEWAAPVDIHGANGPAGNGNAASSPPSTSRPMQTILARTRGPRTTRGPWSSTCRRTKRRCCSSTARPAGNSTTCTRPLIRDETMETLSVVFDQPRLNAVERRRHRRRWACRR